MRRGAITLLAIAAMALSWAGACRRRPANGTCMAHIDCAPGYDCRDRRCVKRPPVPGTAVEPAVEAPVIPPPAPAPKGEPPAPALQEEAPRPKPPQPESTPQENNPAPPPENLPLWKARLKDS